MEETQSDSDLEPPPSSHLRPITNLDPPLPASVLLDRELSHKSSLRRKGNILTGCPELDEYILLGGFERGSVVGISSEDEEFALRTGLQTVANLLVSKPGARARIVTTLPPVGLLPKLREVVAGEVVERQGAEAVPGGLRAVVYGYFGRVEISRVFDFEGLRDVIGELEGEGTGDVLGRGESGIAAEDKDGCGVEVVEKEAPADVAKTPSASCTGTLSGEALVVRTVAELPHGSEVTTNKEPDVEPACGQVPSPEDEDVHQTSTAMSDPDSSLSPPPTSPIDPREEIVSTLPDIRPIPERVAPVHTRRSEILDGGDMPNSTPPNSSPLSSPPLSSPPTPQREQARSPRSARPPFEIPDSETESLEVESAESPEESVLEPSQTKPEIPEPGLPKLPGLQSSTPGIPEIQPPEPQPRERTAPKQTKPTPQKGGPPKQNNPSRGPLPDLILITHTSTLLNTLFAGRDKHTAHEKASLLSSRLHHLTRSPNHGYPLVILLNSTTSPFTPETAAQTGDYLANMARPPIPREADPSERPRNIIEPTLRSVFGVSSAASMRRGQAQRGKPSFGNVFAKMLDVHMLCTRIPRGVDGGSSWVVEVLLDGLGVYEMEGDGEEKGVVRRCREQRWGPLEIDGAGRVVAAFR